MQEGDSEMKSDLPKVPSVTPSWQCIELGRPSRLSDSKSMSLPLRNAAQTGMGHGGCPDCAGLPQVVTAHWGPRGGRRLMLRLGLSQKRSPSLDHLRTL